MKKYLCILLFSLLSSQVFSNHIVGGEMFYNYLGNNRYELVLKIYRDALGNGAWFDGLSGTPALVTIYDVSDSVIGVIDIGIPSVTNVPPSFNNSCVKADVEVEIQQGVYTKTLTLPPKKGGYTIIYQTCCRNAAVINLLDPTRQGASYYTRIPGPEEAPGNSSPRFLSSPPLFLCQGVIFQYDHSAFDPDGDQLIYSLCEPYQGTDGCCGFISNPTSMCGVPCPTAAVIPILPVLFTAPYSGSYPIPSNPAFSINPSTGLFIGTPNLQGQYVVGVCIQEVRNNVVINTHFRDFQFTVINCQVKVLSAVADQAQQCQGLTINFRNLSLNESEFPSFFWDFGVPNITSDTSNLNHPSYTYPDTGVYVVTLVNNPKAACSDTLRRKVYVYPKLDISFAGKQTQCFSNNSLNFNIEGSHPVNTSLFWDFTSAASPSSSTTYNPSGIHYTKPGVFRVKVNASYLKCFDSYSDNIQIFAKPVAKINNIQSALCDPALVGFSNGSISELPVKYTWSFSNGQTSTEFEPSQIFTPPGVYQALLLVETTSPCRDTALFRLPNIVVNPSPKAGFIMSPTETTIFEPDIKINNTGSRDVFTLFDFGDGQNSEDQQNMHTYSEFGTYRVKQTLTNSYGCVDTASQILKILPEFRFWIPNSFTPDGNDRNDLFMPSTYGVSVYNFEIFDSWGRRIFKTNKTDEGWNGSYKGMECQQGIYVWKISFKNAASQQEENHSGHVMLLRNP